MRSPTQLLCLITFTFLFPFTALLPADQADEALALPPSDEGLPGAGPIRRYDWFQTLWKERRQAWLASKQTDMGAVAFLGDSITQGWGDDMNGSFPGMKVANRGISGDTTRGMLVRLDQDVLAINPAAVVLLAGTNDLEENAPPEIIAGNLKLLLDGLHSARPAMPVIVCQIFPSSASKARPAARIREINHRYAELVKGDKLVTFIETWPLFADAAGDAKPGEFPDLLHPNAAGYAKWAAALRPIFATLGLLENHPDDFSPEPGFASLFNGTDLTGWGYRSGDGPVTPFDGKKASPEGRYIAAAGRITVTTPPEGSRISQMWTTREFPGNFTLRLQFRATPNADSGVFIRKPQLQCRDYSLAGPWKDLTRYKAQDWNDLEVIVRDGTATSTCNGEPLGTPMALPPSGPIGLEGDRGQMEYRRLRLRKD